MQSTDPLSIYCELFRRLHMLWVEGKGESDEADAIRDAGDDPWRKLTAGDRERFAVYADELSAAHPIPEPAG